MRRSSIVLLLMIAALSSVAVSQRAGAPRVSLTAGVGHPFGGVGLQGELVIADGRLGIIGGAGTLPGFHYLRSPLTGAVNSPYYFTQQQHRKLPWRGAGQTRKGLL